MASAWPERSPRRTCAGCSSPGRRPPSAAGPSWSRSPCTRTRSAAPPRSASPRWCGWCPAGLAAPLLGLAADRFPRRDVLLAADARPRRAARRRGAGRRAGRRSRSCSSWPRCSRSRRPRTSPPRPRCSRGSRPTRRQAAANALWTAIDNAAFIVGAIAGGRCSSPRSAPPPPSPPPRRRSPSPPLSSPRIARDRVARPRAAGARLEALAGLRVVARDRRLRLLVGVLSVSTLIEGMVDVLVVVTALRARATSADAGVGWLNAAWGVGGLAGGAVALALVARGRLAPRAARRRPADRAAAARAGVAAAGRSPRSSALLVLGVGYSLRRGRRASRCCSGWRTTASAPARSPSSRARTG